MQLTCIGLVVSGLVLWAASPATRAADAPPDPSLILHYTFDQDLGDRAKDLNPHGNDGKIVNAKVLEELDGRQGVLSLGDKESFLDCGNSDSLKFSGDMSLEMRVRLHQSRKNGNTILFGDTSRNRFFLTVGKAAWQLPEVFTEAETDTLLLWYRNGHETMILPLNRNVLSEQWSHFAVVVEYPRCRFYHNGELIRDAYMPIPTALETQSSSKRIGGGRSQTLPMDLDEFRMYRRALTTEEVVAHARGEEVPPDRAEELAVEPHWYD